MRLVGSHIRNRFPRKRARDFIYFSELMQITQDNSFSKKSKGRKRGEENAGHHYRKGVAGDWRNYFEDRHIDLFKERYNDCLLKLGYEEDEDWH
ncbi:sulfotransferase domain-containing protein [Ruegeria sp. 6PALISEP08]|uniref:sulfotransferase domain-containing protein n=1 Tax=Ruegeria sp. 6PALISEP08 TaxID=1225660 RepID=UPI000A51A24F|nr:sulfotransferase domain-containing protein [Ruegeria sp. 6PALISEP08]